MNTHAGASQRRYDLDWLRVLSILSVFIFHSSRFFDQGYWHVKNGATYPGVDIWVAFLAAWMMPLIFLISGASLYYAIAKGGAGKFVKDKVLRLAVPLAVGAFTHAAWMVYLERITHGQFSGSFLEFIPHYFDGLYGFGGNFAWMGLHLWYLLILFIFSLLLYPVFRWLRAGGSAVLQRACDLLALPGAVYLMALPVIVLFAMLNPAGILGMRDFGGWSLVIYLLFFIYGFAIISHARLQQSIQKLRWISLAGAAGALVGTVLVHGFGSDPAFGTMSYAASFGFYSLCGWCVILAILGFGMRHLTRTLPALQYANEAVLPFYVMHQTVLLTVGYFIVATSIPDILKFVVIAVVSFGIIAGLYEFLIRRYNALRFLFGMKPLQRAPRAVGKPAAPVGGYHA